jgi:protein TonB
MSKLSKINIFDSNWVDLVFKGRNHDYGAYVLRKKSNENTNKGIIYAIIFFTLVISTPALIDLIKGIVPKDKEDVKVTEVTTLKEPPPLDEKTPPPPPAEPPPPLKSTVRFTPPEIKPDEQVPDEPPPAQDEMKDKDAGVADVEGDPNGIDASLQLPSGDGLTGDAEPEFVTFAEQSAEFPNGDLMEWLSKNIHYPDRAKDVGVDGKVVIQFVVEKDGKITNVEVIKKAGWGFDEEAIEVVKKMPPWKPAKQNGKPVRLQMNLPIRFTLSN